MISSNAMSWYAQRQQREISARVERVDASPATRGTICTLCGDSGTRPRMGANGTIYRRPCSRCNPAMRLRSV